MPYRLSLSLLSMPAESLEANRDKSLCDRLKATWARQGERDATSRTDRVGGERACEFGSDL